MIFAEYAMDTADACHALGMHSVAVTAGYMHAAPRREFYAKMDAANVDLKGFTEEFYFQQTGAHLAPVLDTLQYLRHETDCWFEITTLLIPGHNDSSAEIDAMTRWIAEQLGPDVPLHFTAFHPDYKMLDVPPTPAGDADARAQDRARQRLAPCLHRQRARRRGRHHVLPRLPSSADPARLVPRARMPRRSAGRRARRLPASAAHAIPGRFGAFNHGFGRRRIPVRMTMQ